LCHSRRCDVLSQAPLDMENAKLFVRHVR
jgi:hypothetical protein